MRPSLLLRFGRSFEAADEPLLHQGMSPLQGTGNQERHWQHSTHKIVLSQNVRLKALLCYLPAQIVGHELREDVAPDDGDKQKTVSRFKPRRGSSQGLKADGSKC